MSNSPAQMSPGPARKETADFAGKLGRRIFAVVFDGVPSALVIARFSEGFQRLCSGTDPAEIESLRYALENVRYFGALEVAARYTHRHPLLVASFRLLVYVAEADPANQRFFVKRQRSVPGAVAALILGGMHTVVSMLVGMVIIRRLKT